MKLKPCNGLHLMQMPTAPIWLGDQCYACNPQGLHVPLTTLSVEQMRFALNYRASSSGEEAA